MADDQPTLAARIRELRQSSAALTFAEKRTLEETADELERLCGDVKREVEAVWDDVIEACQAAWPDRKPLVYSDSPTELITEIINERDEAATSEADRVRGWLLHLAGLCVEGSPRYATLIEIADDVARGIHRLTPR